MKKSFSGACVCTLRHHCICVCCAILQLLHWGQKTASDSGKKGKLSSLHPAISTSFPRTTWDCFLMHALEDPKIQLSFISCFTVFKAFSISQVFLLIFICSSQTISYFWDCFDAPAHQCVSWISFQAEEFDVIDSGIHWSGSNITWGCSCCVMGSYWLKRFHKKHPDKNICFKGFIFFSICDKLFFLYKITFESNSLSCWVPNWLLLTFLSFLFFKDYNI